MAPKTGSCSSLTLLEGCSSPWRSTFSARVTAESKGRISLCGLAGSVESLGAGRFKGSDGLRGLVSGWAGAVVPAPLSGLSVLSAMFVYSAAAKTQVQASGDTFLETLSDKLLIGVPEWRAGVSVRGSLLGRAEEAASAMIPVLVCAGRGQCESLLGVTYVLACCWTWTRLFCPASTSYFYSQTSFSIPSSPFLHSNQSHTADCPP